MIPEDPIILLSFVNTQLRDKCKNLKDFCVEYDVNEDLIRNKLKRINYIYSDSENRFI